MKQRPSRESKLLKGFGAVTPYHRPEDWARVRAEVETLIAADVATCGKRTAPGERTAPKEEEHE